MFDFAWSEIALIGVVALIAIGPKDMPVAIKAAAQMMKKARRMASEFQTHVDDLVREADLHEVRDQLNEIRNFDIRGHVERTVDADGSIRAALNENPLGGATSSYSPPATPATPAVTATDAAAPAQEIAAHPAPAIPRPADVPAFVPPGMPNPAKRDEPPAFIPPATAAAGPNRA